MSLRLRILAVLGVLVALNALFVLVILWTYGVLLVFIVAGLYLYVTHGEVAFDLLQLPVSVSTYLLLVGVFLVGQIYYGYSRVLDNSRALSNDETAVSGIVRRLAQSANVPEPGTRIVESDSPGCYTVGRFTDATIVVTTGLIERLDADELEAVLAHEIAHIVNRDVTLMTITTLFLEIADRAYHATLLAGRVVRHPSQISERTELFVMYFAPFVVLTYLFVSPLLWIFPRLADWATRTLSHAREFAADEAGARLAGKPLALATALLALDESVATPETDLRRSRTAVLSIVPTDIVTGTEATTVPESGEPVDRENRARAVSNWLDGTTPEMGGGQDTHPPVEERIRRLTDLAAELEAGP